MNDREDFVMAPRLVADGVILDPVPGISAGNVQAAVEELSGRVGSGDVVGPGSSTDGNLAVFDGATGKVLKDGGVSPADFATSSQGSKADTALQSVVAGSNVTVDDTDPLNPVISATGGGGGGGGDVTGPASATDGEMVLFDGSTGKLIKGGGAPFSGDYEDLSNKPTLGTAAAADTGDFATAAQGGKADTALQSGDIGTSVQAYDAYTAKTDAVQEWSASQRSDVVSLSVVSGDIDWSLADGNDFTVTLTANATLNLPGDIATHVGQKGRILITQDGTGGRTFAADEDIVPLGAEDMPDIPTDPGAMAYLAYDVISATQIVFSLMGVGE